MAIYLGSTQVSNMYKGSTAAGFYVGSNAVGLVPTTGLVANNFQMATGGISGMGANTAHHRQHYASPEGDISELVFTDSAWYINTTTFSINTLAATSTFRKYVEYPSGTYTPVLYSGSTTYTLLNSGGNVSSDTLSITIPAGEKFWEHTICLTGGAVANMIAPAQHATLGLDQGTYTFSGTPTRTGTTKTTTNSFGSTCITGKINKTNAKSFSIVGDSIAWGQGDISSTGPKGGSGYIARGLDDRYPWMKMAVPGMTAGQLAALAASPSLNGLITACKTSHMIHEHGGGDLRVGTIVDDITAAYGTIYNLFPNRHIYQTTVVPRTDSTDSYTTVENQTAKTDGNWAAEVDLNTVIRTFGDFGYGVIESSDAASSAHDSRLWKAPPAWTTDGVHPNSYAADQLATNVIVPYTFT